MHSLDQINSRLKTQYGTNVDGRVRFRVVWAPDQTEVRYDTFDEAQNFLDVSSKKQYPKYSYLGECWILEALVNMPHPAIPETNNGHYECIRSFKRKDGRDTILPILKAVEYHVYNAINHVPRKSHDFRNESEAKAKATTQKDYDQLGGVSKSVEDNMNPLNDTKLGESLHEGNAVFIKGS